MEILDKVKEQFDGITKPDYSDSFWITIKADVNDGDYITSDVPVGFGFKLEVLIEKKIPRIIDICNKIFENGDYNWKNRDEYLTEDEIEHIGGLLPSSTNDYEEIHTIESVQIHFESKQDSIRYLVKKWN